MDHRNEEIIVIGISEAGPRYVAIVGFDMVSPRIRPNCGEGVRSQAMVHLERRVYLAVYAWGRPRVRISLFIAQISHGSWSGTSDQPFRT